MLHTYTLLPIQPYPMVESNLTPILIL